MVRGGVGHLHHHYGDYAGIGHCPRCSRPLGIVGRQKGGSGLSLGVAGSQGKKANSCMNLDASGL